MSNDYNIFTGSNKKQPENLSKLPKQPPPWRDFHLSKNREQRAATYQADPHEIDMVNAALLLCRPLLITGKPGTGKSSLAHAIAHELDLGEVLIWPITSKSTLQHGLYSYDALARLQDASLQKSNPVPDSEYKALDIGRYIRLGAIGTAFLKSESQKPCVVLIDEIDKSDIDLPNDLLHLFEEGEFEIPELARLAETEKDSFEVYAHKSKTKLEIPNDGMVRCQSFPLIIMTSNGEREFPPAFLRRCLRLNLEEPTKANLIKIVNSHFSLKLPTEGEINRKELSISEDNALTLIEKFFELRETEKQQIATDQLLNAVYLATETTMDVVNQEDLRKAIFATLTEN